MIDMRRSTVNRPSSALRMREKSAAAIPVRPCAARTLRCSRSSALMISAARMPLNCSTSAFLCPRSRNTLPLSPHHLQLFAFHRSISFNLFKRSLYQVDFVLGRPDALRRFFLERMDHPDLGGKLHRVYHANGIAFKRQRDLKHARAMPRRGFAMSALAPPSAAMVREPQGRSTWPLPGRSRIPSAPP